MGRGRVPRREPTGVERSKWCGRRGRASGASVLLFVLNCTGDYFIPNMRTEGGAVPTLLGHQPPHPIPHRSLRDTDE